MGAPGGGNREEKARKLWRLTPAGIQAAAQLLPPERTMGGTVRGAGRHGSGHAMAVNETILAFIQPVAGDGQDDIDQDVDEPLDQALDQDVHDVRSAGIGSIASWTTEVTLPVTGSVSAPAKGSPRPDAVLVAPETDPPLPFLCVEVDTSSETIAVVASKFERYRRFFRRAVNEAPPGHRRPRYAPFWRTLYGDSGREGHPPVAVVFTGAGPRSLANREQQLGELTRSHWAGHRRSASSWLEPEESYVDYSDAIPIIATTLDLLREHGPLGAVWWRYGHSGRETLADALANPDDKHAYNVRRQKRDDATDARRRAEEAEREASRPVCTSCGSKFTDARRSQVEIWPNDAHPGLCARCAAQAQREEEEEEEKQRQAEAAAREAAAAGLRRFFGRRRG
ncbi:replication-relaxation family protein [Streptomyces sp. NRRL F-2890]|uniref:replication-relaxation family protein n=1 Tax=Streptomyces sp. NRRL F-2890 TaxID=1463845 RepID=UPI00099773D5|nr:replication-relaxation family protein [Streptomyces sp. NRRL F-2890]